MNIGDMCNAGARPNCCECGELASIVPDCTACSTGKYSNTAATVCTDCPADKTSTAGASVCVNPGCAAGSYGSSGNCQICPAGSYSTVQGASTCIGCSAGTYSGASGASSSTACTNCLVGTYSGGLGMSACITCPAGSTSPSGSSSVAACVATACNAGFTGPNGGPCTACVAGKYKTTSGITACIDCGAGTYSTSTGATLAATCLACPLNSNSAIASSASTACTCNAGFPGPNGGPCIACVAGKYKTTSGSVVCKDCVVGTYSTSTGVTLAATCLACPLNSNSAIASSASTACTCNAGFPGPNGGPCIACVAGKYKTTSGSVVCKDCVVGTYSTSTGATISTTCITCPISSSSSLASSALAACTCNSGSTGPDGGVCSACIEGNYKIDTGSAVCTNCLAGTYSGVTGASSAIVCTNCLAGAYSLAGESACTVCPINTFSGASASSCQSCQANALSVSGSTSQEYCYCKSGYAHAAGAYTCRICDPGTYNSQLGSTACSNCSVGLYSFDYGAIGNETCLSCPLGQWSPEGSPSCNLCPVNSRAAARSGSITNCTCNAGYAGPNGGLCWTRTNLTCSVCPVNTYDSGGVCAACMNNTVSVPASLACQCKAGFTGTPDACQACPAGTYKRMAGTSPCRSCQANSVSENASVLCRCNAGYTGNTGDVCVACVAGKYKNVTGPAACVSCAQRRNSVVAATNVTNCICDISYTQVENASLSYELVYAQACVACDVGKFKPLIGVQACTSCGLNQSAVAASPICSCVTGFTGPDGGPCAECALGKYKDWLGSQACTTCPANSYTFFTRNTLLSNCTCNVAYTGPDGGPCPACVGGKYKSVTGTSACITCDADFYSTLSIAATSCSACPAGYQSLPGTAIAADCCGFNSLPYYGEVNLARTCGASGADGCPASAPNFFQNNYAAFGPQNAVNGIIDNGYISACCGGSQWFMIDFQRKVTIQYVEIQGSCWWRPEWLANFNLQLSDDGGTFTNCATAQYGTTTNGCVSTHTCIGSGRFLRLTQSKEYLQLPEVRVYAVGILCACNTGYTGANFGASKGQCTTCLAGTYKATNGSEACTLCAANTYHNISTATSVTSCLGCAENSIATAGEKICLCAPGFTGPDAGPCVACDAGKYKNWRDSSICPFCPPNSDSVAGTSLCPCNIGYTGPLGGPCVACVPGKYKDTNGTAVCTTCPANSYEPDIAAVIVTNCTCNTGFDGADGGPCTGCALGKYKNNNDTTPCVECPADTYIDVQGSAYCKTCPEFTTSPVGSGSIDACLCKLGYTGGGGAVTVGVISSNLGRTCGTNLNQACPSAASTTRGGTSSNALDNDVNTIFITESGGDQWFKIDFGKVVHVQSFKIVVVHSWEVDYHRNIQVRVGNIDLYSSNPACYIHTGSLITLGVGISYWTRTISCTTPLEGQYLFYVNPPGLNYIEFGEFSPIGFSTLPQTACAACVIGKYKDAIGSALCSYCPATTFSGETNATSIETCAACPADSTSLLGSASKDYCQCNVGFVHEGAGCSACLPGTYNPRLAEIACSNCTVGTSSLNYGAVSNETCASCRETEYSQEGSPFCEPCPPNSVAPAKSSRIEECGCTFGYTGPTESLCVKCAPGGYKNITGDYLCETCSVNSYSLSGATALTSCFCNPGYTGAYGPLCVACVLGKYKSVYGSAACTDCAANTYADRTGMTVCTACVNTSASPVASESIWNCTCNAGYKGPTYQEVAYHENFARSCAGSACATTQSSTLTTQVMVGVYDFLNTANFANDNSSATFSTTAYGTGQWWRVDFERRVTVQAVKVLFSNFAFDVLYVLVGDANSSTANLICASVAVNTSSSDWATATCASALTGRYLYVRNSIASQVTMKEIQVQGTEVLTKIWPDWCEKCPLGTYKSVAGTSACVACPSNRFSATLASTSISACLSCPSNSVAATGSDQCVCDKGFFGPENACTACGTDTFKTQVGASTCEICPANSVIAPNASTSAMPCTCLSGYQPS